VPTIDEPVLISDRLVPSRMYGSPHGPWQYGSRRFVVGVDIGSSTITTRPLYIAVFESTDGTTWTECDSSNRPLGWSGSTSTVVVTPMYAHRVDSLIWVAYPNPTTREINFTSFDMSTRTWGAVITSGPVVMDNTGPTITKRSDGSFVFVYSAPGAANNFVVYDGGWETPITVNPFNNVGIPDGAQPLSAVLGDSDRIHVFFLYSQLVGHRVQHRSIQSDDSLGTLQYVTPIIGGTNYVGFVQYSNSEIFFPWGEAASDPGPEDAEAHLVRAASAVDPTWTDEVITPTVIGDYPAFHGLFYQSVVYSESTWHHFWCYDFDDGVTPFVNYLYRNTLTGATWGADDLIFQETYSEADGGRLNSPYANAITSGYGIVMMRDVGSPSLRQRLHYMEFSHHCPNYVDSAAACNFVF